MGFSWVTFIAQIVNLLVLIWLLKRFLYKPILKAIDRRQAFIMDKVQKAQEAKDLAEKERVALTEKRLLFEQENAKRLNALARDIAGLKSRQLADLDKEIALLRQKKKSELAQEIQSAELEVRNLFAAQFMLLSRKAMSDLSGLAPLEQAVALFQKRIRSLKKSEKGNVRKALSRQSVIFISTSAPLPARTKTALVSFVRRAFRLPPAAKIQVRTDAALILGIELSAGDITLEWHLKSYLDALAEHINHLLTGA
ncbi:MAG: hypothetical protein PHX68_01490 [Alphaproteobacteria bacterium]|nr:hypothetical protein [Alphaproteobacteria bacterium]